MDPIRVIVIDDSAFMRKMVSGILDSDKRIQVIATARNGLDGLAKIKEMNADVVTLDVEMPVMDGITTLKEIMNTNPLPVVMLSSVTSEGATKTVQAISNGAVDFISKPSGSISLDIDKIKDEIIAKVIAAANVNVQKTKEAVNIPAPACPPNVHNHARSIVAIGTSTGGPRALQRVLTDLPENFSAPILIVQHMPAGFTKSLADRLNTLASIHVKEAVHGELIMDKTAYIAPGNYHMKIRQVGISYAIELSEEKPLSGHRPSVDVLFESFANISSVNKIAVVLTGMGSDGSKGVQMLKKSDPSTVVIAEAEESCIVYGMPKATVQTNHANYVVHLHQVGETIGNLTKK